MRHDSLPIKHLPGISTRSTWKIRQSDPPTNPCGTPSKPCTSSRRGGSQRFTPIKTRAHTGTSPPQLLLRSGTRPPPSRLTSCATHSSSSGLLQRPTETYGGSSQSYPPLASVVSVWHLYCWLLQRKEQTLGGGGDGLQFPAEVLRTRASRPLRPFL